MPDKYGVPTWGELEVLLEMRTAELARFILMSSIDEHDLLPSRTKAMMNEVLERWNP